MTLKGLPAQLVKFLFESKEWVSKGYITDITWYHKSGSKHGKRYLPETVGRALRTLEESSIIAVKPDGISVQYKWIPHEMRNRYLPYSMRARGKESVLFTPKELVE